MSTKKCILILADIIACVFGFIPAYIMITLAGFDRVSKESLLLSFLFLPVCMVMGMLVTRAYDIILRYASTIDFARCLAAMGIGMLTYMLGDIVIGFMNEAIFRAISGTFGGLAMIGMRIAYFTYVTDRQIEVSRKCRKRTLIVGAGKACRTIIEEMKESNYFPVAIVDDDRQKQNREICSVKVVGNTSQIKEICKKYEIESILFAIPSCENEERKRILQMCADAECEVKILPFVHELVGNGNLLLQAKKVSVEDLLGREPVTFEDDGLINLIQDQVLMVTGGGGSIGSELCRQIAKCNPKKLIIFDIYENNAYDIQQELKRDYGTELNLHVEIGSVRDYEKLDAVFEKHSPKVVFHAAAHKHVPLMEDNPEEAVKNNVFGTFHCAKLADKHKVNTFVLISTDKAVNPTNIMGATKRICEMILQYMAQKTVNTRFCAVRFGNVLGSNGSVIPLFNRQIEKGGPVVVTHPDIIRYFMTIPEAVSLVLKAAGMAKNSEIFVLDMGKQVRILDLAEKLIRLRGYVPYVNMDIIFSGLRPGEKLYEELLMSEEGLTKTIHNKIFIGKQIEVDGSGFLRQLNILKEASKENNYPLVVRIISDMVPTYRPSVEKTGIIASFEPKDVIIRQEEKREPLEVGTSTNERVAVTI